MTVETFPGANRTNLTGCDQPWTVTAGFWGVASNAAAFGTVLSNGFDQLNRARCDVDEASEDMYAELTLVEASSAGYEDVRVQVRMNASNQACYTAYWDATTITVERNTAAGGLSQNLGTRSATRTLGDVLRLEVEGVGATVTLRVKVNGVQVGADYTDTSAGRIVTGRRGGISGFLSGAGSVRVDNYGQGSLAPPPDEDLVIPGSTHLHATPLLVIGDPPDFWSTSFPDGTLDPEFDVIYGTFTNGGGGSVQASGTASAVRDCGAVDHRMVTTVVLSATPNAIFGGMLRWVDDQNHVGFEVVRSGTENVINIYTRLAGTYDERKTTWDFEYGQTRVLECEVVGSTIHGWVDGVPVPTVTMTGPQSTALIGTSVGPFGFAGVNRWLDVAALAPRIPLDVQGSEHAHPTDSLSLTGESALVVPGSNHGHASETTAPTVTTSLTTADSTHTHASQATTLSTTGTLATFDTVHGHTSDGIDLDAATGLDTLDSSHAHVSTTITYSSIGTLTTASSRHRHTSTTTFLGSDGDLVDFPSNARATHRTVTDANVTSRVASPAHVTTGTTTQATATTRENAWQSTGS